jgi:hypothetical protein
LPLRANSAAYLASLIAQKKLQMLFRIFLNILCPPVCISIYTESVKEPLLVALLEGTI